MIAPASPKPTENAVTRIQPNPGPQEEFFKSDADIVVYGGGAGGGKSWALLADPLRYINVPGFRGIVFRRTCPQITGQGGLWDESQELYRQVGGVSRENVLDWSFPSGANLCMGHMQHEKNKYDHQGLQYAYIGLDELTHFTATMFFYLIGRNRSVCGVKPYIRATCNPEPGWVADLLAWWIDQETGLAIPERSGVIRYFLRDGEELVWADTREELLERFPDNEPDDVMSLTFIPAKLDDNPVLLEKDPGYRGRLKSLSKIERDRLLGCNWKVAEGAQIDQTWIRRFTHNAANFEIVFQGHFYTIPIAKARRFATIDTAGTSKEKAQVERGNREPSWSICSVWDAIDIWTTTVDGMQVRLTELLFLRYVWRKQVDWNNLRSGINSELETWNVTKAYIENAHFGQALASEIRVCPAELVGPVIPGMGDHGEDAKLERAIASGMLARFEQGKIFIPREHQHWIPPWLSEVLAWTGKPTEVADQIDTISYAAYLSKQKAMVWGGTLNHSPNSFRANTNGQRNSQVATRTNR